MMGDLIGECGHQRREAVVANEFSKLVKEGVVYYLDLVRLDYKD